MPDMLMTLEPGDIPGNPPQVPSHLYHRAGDDLYMLLDGWEQAVIERGMSRRYLRAVQQVIRRVERGYSKRTTVHNLIVTALAPAFLLPGEMEVIGMTEELASEIGINVEHMKSLPHTYSSLFEIPTKAGREALRLQKKFE